MAWIRSTLMWGVVAGGAALLVFGPRPDLGTREDEVTVVDYWEKWGGLEGSQMQQIVDAFNETVGREKSIFVRYLSVSSVNQKTLVATAAGVPPGHCRHVGEQRPAVRARWARWNRWTSWRREYGITETYYKEVYWKGCQYEGQLYALVSTPWSRGPALEQGVFEEAADRLRAAGLDPDRAPATLDELDAYAEAAQRGRRERMGAAARATCRMHPGLVQPRTCPSGSAAKLYDEPQPHASCSTARGRGRPTPGCGATPRSSGSSR